MAARSRFGRFLLSSWLGLVAGAFAPLGAGQLLGDGQSLLTRMGDRYFLAFGGAEVDFAPPALTELESVVSLDSRVLVSGVRQVVTEGSEETELYLALAASGRVSPLPAPPGRRAGESREQATAVVDARGGLAGLAWLEGASSRVFRVMSARWSRSSWSAPEEVAPAGPGSQQALAGATLDDGRPILVWTRFDGSDDEIVWSVLENGRWTEARPLAEDNAVPDIVPAIVAVPGGALAAWSRYDGHDYRAVVARFDGRAWSAPSEAGGPGTLFPSFVRTASGARLLVASSRPHGWSVADLDASGRALRRAVVERGSPDRPVLVGDELRWDGEKSRLRWN